MLDEEQLCGCLRHVPQLGRACRCFFTVRIFARSANEHVERCAVKVFRQIDAVICTTAQKPLRHRTKRNAQRVRRKYARGGDVTVWSKLG